MRGVKAKRIRWKAAMATPPELMGDRYEAMPGTKGRTRRLAVCFRATYRKMKRVHRRSKMLDI